MYIIVAHDAKNKTNILIYENLLTFFPLVHLSNYQSK